MMKEKAIIEGRVGRFSCGKLKNLVSRMKFVGHDIDIWFGEGMISKEFVIKGDREILERLNDAFKEMNSEKQQ